MSEKQSNIPKNLPGKLRLLRQEKEWSQGQLAKKLGTDVPRISKYERGVVSPTTDMMIKMSEVFGVSLDYLLRDQNEAKISNPDLLKRVDEISSLSEEDQRIVAAVLDTFIKRHRFEKLAANS